MDYKASRRMLWRLINGVRIKMEDKVYKARQASIRFARGMTLRVGSVTATKADARTAPQVTRSRQRVAARSTPAAAGAGEEEEPLRLARGEQVQRNFYLYSLSLSYVSLFQREIYRQRV